MSSKIIAADALNVLLQNVEPKVIPIAKGTPDSAGFAVVPNGMKVESVKKYLDEFRLLPERRTGTECADRLQSFIDLVNRFKGKDSVVFAKSAISGNAMSASLYAIFDYHPANAINTDARHKAHKARYCFPVSKELTFWLKNNATETDQAGFAIMLEERISEMVAANDEDKAQIANLSPKFAEPLEVLELSRNLEIYSAEQVTQSLKLSSGERNLKFTAVHNGADGKPISVPDFFVLNIPVFDGDEPERILVRLRYRKQGEKINWSYDLYRVDRVFQKAFDLSVSVVKSDTALPIFMGEAAS